jgi:anti-sigma factor (TIGR02949 family)
MTRLLTCKQLLTELNAYLDEETTPEERAALQRHINECPNCWVVVDTTQKTLQVYKGVVPQAVPNDVKERLMTALQRRFAERQGRC